MGDGFREHGLMLYLGPELYIGFIQLQADEKLGRSYAGLKIFVEGMHSLGYLKDADYEVLKSKYSQGLVKEQPLSMEQIQTDYTAKDMGKKFSMVLEQWNLDRPNKEQWRNQWIREAEVWKDKVPQAKLVLDLRSAS
jgi:hypothetical protein